jgi:hypothetical protein
MWNDVGMMPATPKGGEDKERGRKFPVIFIADATGVSPWIPSKTGMPS